MDTNTIEIIKRKRLARKVAGSIIGTCVGDALGLPCECSSPSDIRKRFGYIDKFVSNYAHPFQNVAKQPPASISDDSQLTLAMMFALRHGYNLKKIIDAHIKAYDGRWGTPVGWGRSTREACIKMKQGTEKTMTLNGAGNGTCMKIAPLGIYCVYKTAYDNQIEKFSDIFNVSLLKKCKEITELTHGHPMCIVAAYCQSRMIIRAMQDELPETDVEIAQLFINDALFAENNLSAEWPDGLLLSDRLRSILTVDNFKFETSEISVTITTKESSFVYNSYPLVAYCFSKYSPYKNARFAITEAVNAGADADSNASMVGALIGAQLGFASIPKEWVSKLINIDMVLRQIKIFEESLLQLPRP